jgi:hypothetical protein
MGEARIEIKVGAVSFSGEGEGKWLSEQLDKVLEKIPELTQVVPPQPPDEGGETDLSGAHKKGTGTLAIFLRERKATGNQTRKFLATAAWLHDHGKDRVTTIDVTKALSDAKQSALGNPSQCLASNVGKGFCQKLGKKDFFVTPEGRAELGL